MELVRWSIRTQISLRTLLQKCGTIGETFKCILTGESSLGLGTPNPQAADVFLDASDQELRPW